MDVIIKVDEIVKILKKTGFQFFKEGQVPKGTKQPYFTYRGTCRERTGDESFDFTFENDSINIMKSNVYLEVLKKWQVALNLTFWGSYDRASVEMEPLDHVIQILNETRTEDNKKIPRGNVNKSNWKIGMYRLFLWGFGWNVENGLKEKESDRKTNVNIIFDVVPHSSKIEIPTPDETETILKESKEFDKNIKMEV